MTSPDRSSIRSRTLVAGAVVARSVAGSVVVATLAGCANNATPAPMVACPGWTAQDYLEARVVRKLRVYTDRTTGDSAIEDTIMTPRATPLLKTGKILVEYPFGPSGKTQIVAGPANLDIPLHPAPYRESFLILQGSVTMRLGDGSTRDLVPGDMTTYEDTDASRGHGGITGPCGYVALNLVP